MSPSNRRPALAASKRVATTFRDRVSRSSDQAPFGTRGVVDAVGSGIVAAVATWLVTFLPVLLGWSLGVPRRTGVGTAAAVSVDLWALGHRATVAADGLLVTFAPLLLTAGFVALAWLAMRWLAGPDRDTSGWLGARAWEPALAVAGYAASGLLVITLGNLGRAQVVWWSAVPGLVLVPALGALTLALRTVGGETWTDRVAGVWDRAAALREAWRPALEGAGAALLGGLGLVALAVLGRFDRVTGLHEALRPDGTGTLLLVLAQVLTAPNLAVWALGWSSGATLSFGEANIDLMEAQGGTLPLIPLLGVLPEGGPMPWWSWFALALPLGVGVLMGWRLDREVLLGSAAEAALPAVVAAALAGLGLTLLVWLSGGGVTPGSLTRIGVPPLVTGGLLTFEMAVGSVVTVLLRRGFLGWRG